MGNAGYDKETGDLFFAAHKSLRGRYVRGVERTIHLVSSMLTVVALGPDSPEMREKRRTMIHLIEKFYEDLKREQLEPEKLDHEWLELLKGEL